MITPNQLGLINKIIVDRDFLKEELSLTKSIILDKDQIISNQYQQLSNYSIITSNYEQRIANFNKLQILQSEILAEERKRLNRRTWVYGGCAIGIGLIIGLLAK